MSTGARTGRIAPAMAAAMGLALWSAAAVAAEGPVSTPDSHGSPAPTFYFPRGAAARIVTVTATGPTAAGITVLTEALATKEAGPKETVARFGEVYAFSPAVLVVHRDEPTALSFWNLQGDDEHDVMLADATGNVLMHVNLPPVQETGYVFTFHRAGLFTFYCTLHQPEMSGQILVLPPARRR
jgi:plastocyanin